MDKKSLFLTVLVLAVVLVGGFFGYKALSANFGKKDTAAVVQQTQAPQKNVPTQPTQAPREKVTVQPTQAPRKNVPAQTNTAPDFTVLDNNGNKVKLSDRFGKKIVINIWATWCGPCRSELGHFNKAYQLYGNDITFMMVDMTDGSNETVAGVRQFVKDNGYTFPVYYDTEYSAAIAYGANSIPMTIVIDEFGNVEATQIGSMDETMLMRLIGVQ